MKMIICALLTVVFFVNVRDIAAAEVLATSFTQTDILQYSQDQVASTDLTAGQDGRADVLGWLLVVILVGAIVYGVASGNHG